jgi:hypothetical protein
MTKEEAMEDFFKELESNKILNSIEEKKISKDQ